MMDIDRSLENINHAFDIILLTPEEFERDKYIPGTIARYAYKEGKLLYYDREKRIKRKIA
jgi:hypothetical protein